MFQQAHFEFKNGACATGLCVGAALGYSFEFKTRELPQ
jgi:hypothetical protein